MKIGMAPSGGSCGVTAVAAVLQTSIEEAKEAIYAEAARDGEHPQHLINSNPLHQLRAIQTAGHQLSGLDGTKFDAFNDRLPTGPYLTIEDFVKSNSSEELIIGITPQHTFIAQGRNFFDCNTGERVVSADEIPADIASLVMHSAIIVRRNPADPGPAPSENQDGH